MERLYVDHYSALMKVWSVFTIIISALALAATIYFAPVESNTRARKFSVKTSYYKGSFRSGFDEAGPFNSKALTVWEFEPQDKNNNYVVLLSPDKRGDTVNYVPYLEQLALRGVTAYSADFFADDGRWLHSIGDKKFLRRIVMVIQSVINRQSFEAQREYYSYNVSQEYEVLIPMIKSRFDADTKIFLVTDFMADIAAEDFAKKNPDSIAGVFKLSDIEEYKTSGYGCIEQTDPLLAAVLGLRRDKSRSIPNLMASKTVEVLNDLK